MPSKKIVLPESTQVRVPDAVGKSLPEYLSDFLTYSVLPLDILNPIQAGGGGTMFPPFRFLPGCAKVACSRLMKLSDFLILQGII